jgi:hypothetical protein
VARGGNVDGSLTIRSAAGRFPRADGWAPSVMDSRLHMRHGSWCRTPLARTWGTTRTAVAIAPRASEKVPAAIWLKKDLIYLPGISPRPRASVPARTGCTLAVESETSPLARGLPALDQPLGRGEAAPVIGCRAAVDAASSRPPLLPRSYHGPPRPPCGGGWCPPTRSLSGAVRSLRARGGMPGTVTRLAAAAW